VLPAVLEVLEAAAEHPLVIVNRAVLELLVRVITAALLPQPMMGLAAGVVALALLVERLMAVTAYSHLFLVRPFTTRVAGAGVAVLELRVQVV
jgi:hypothetical protein